MSHLPSWAPPDSEAIRERRVSDRLFHVYRTVVWVYGGFLLGILAHAGWVDDGDLVFWPWSAAFLLLLSGLVFWQRRRSAGASSAPPEDQPGTR